MLDSERIRMAAAAAWDALRTHRILPSPRNFELWFAAASGDAPELSRELEALAAAGQGFSPATLDELHRRHVASEMDVAGLMSGARGLRDIARDIGERVLDDQAHAARYAQALDDQAETLRRAPTPEALRAAAQALAEETARARARSAGFGELLQRAAGRIAAFERLLATAEREALCDALTGVANRRAFDAAIRQAMGAGGTFSLLLLDIDHFGPFNERFGHQTGDLLLRLVAKLIAAEAPEPGLAARYGGQVFAVLLPQAPLAEGIRVAEAIRHALERRNVSHLKSGQRLGPVTLSVGVAQLRPGEAAFDLIGRADMALNKAKRSGRNRVSTQGE